MLQKQQGVPSKVLVRESLTEVLQFEQRPEGDEGATCVDIQREKYFRKASVKILRPEHVWQVRIIKEAVVAGVGYMRWKVIKNKVKKLAWPLQ